MSDATLNRFLSSGTEAERAAFVPDPPTPASGPDAGYFWYATDSGASYSWDGAAWQLVAVGAGAGDVTGPVTSTDNAIARWNGTGGTVLADSTPTVEDDGTIASLTDPVNLQDAATKNYVDTAVATVAVVGASQNSFLVAGGQVVWDSAYTFTVSAATYFIGGVLYSSAPDSVTLGAAHATLDRIDVIAVDDTGSVVVIPGTAAAQPSEPDIDPGTQLKLSIVLVTHATSAPATATTTLLYAENTGGPGEWNWTASGASITVNSSSNPRSGTKDIEGTAVVAGVYAEGAIPSGTFDPNSVGLLVLYVRSKAVWANKRGLQVTLRNAGVLQGIAVNIERSGTWGFDSAVVGSYQQIGIPTSAFAIPQGTLITQVRIADFGGSIGFYLDDLSFQGGATSQPVTGITQEQADARYRKLDTPLSVLAPADVGGFPGGSTTFLRADQTFAAPVGAGDVVGPGSAVDDRIATFDGTTGKLMQDGGKTIAGVEAAALAAIPGTIGIVIDGGGSAITTGVKGYVQCPYAGTITSWTLLADVSGSAVVDVWKDVYASYPPVVGDSITASAKPTLSAATKATSSTLTGWTTSITAGDVFAFNVDSATTVTRLTCQLTVTRT